LDVVYVVGEHTDELRYSLRSLKHVVHDRVWVVSKTLPEWVRNVGHIPVGDRWYRVRNVVEKLYAAASHPEVSETFQYWNDDFFALQPTTIPVRHGGLVAPKKPGGLIPATFTGRDAHKWTHWLLRTHWNIDPVYRYELTHTPMVMDKHLLVDAVDQARAVKLTGPAIRSLYGNLNRIGGQEGVNVKVGKTNDPLKEKVWVSTNVNSWNGKAGKIIRNLLSEPSPYERS